MASAFFDCEICGIQVRRTSDGENPLPEIFDVACEEHLEEWRELDAKRKAEEAKAAVQTAENALAEAKAHLAEITKPSKAAAPAGRN